MTDVIIVDEFISNFHSFFKGHSSVFHKHLRGTSINRRVHYMPKAITVRHYMFCIGIIGIGLLQTTVTFLLLYY